ncbi:16500_t:CDS:1, partial [Racocetra persica]
ERGNERIKIQALRHFSQKGARSAKICNDLLKPFNTLPKKISNLSAFLKKPLACKLPVTINVNKFLKNIYFNKENRESELALHINYIL